MIMAESSDDPGGGEVTGGATSHLRDHSPMLHLDLYNFDCPEAEGSRYVLTSPRSLEACARCLIKPVELLSRSLAELVREAPGRSMRVATGLCEVYEIERQRKLQMCREERERIIRQEKRRILPLVMSSSLGSPCISKAPSRAEPHCSTLSQNYIPQISKKHQNDDQPSTSHTQKNQPHSLKESETSSPPLSKEPKKTQHTVSRSLQRSEPSQKRYIQKREPSVSKKQTSSNELEKRELSVEGSIPPASRKSKSQSLDSLQKRDGTSAKTSSGSATSSYSGDSVKDKGVQFIPRPRSLDAVNSLLGRSFSLGDLSQSQQTTKKVERMVKEVKKKGVRELPQRDKKIAAIMIAKHQEENIRNEQRYWAHLQWDMQRRNSELRKEQEEKERHRVLIKGQKLGESYRKSRQSRNVAEMSTASLAKSKSLPTEYKSKGQDQGKQKKTKQEQGALELEEGLLQERLLTAQHKKKDKEEQMQLSKSIQNKAAMMKHQALLQELTQKGESDNEELRKTLENNLKRAQENVEQLHEKRNQELKEKAQMEKLQIQRARQAAEKQEKERKEHLQELARTAEKKFQHASQVAEEVMQHKAKKATEYRLEKEKLQRENRQKVQKNEAKKRQELLVSIEKKLERSDHIIKEKQTVLDNARSVARASFNIREKVRAETNTRTFDKMVLEAEFYAGIDKK
ncbi:hypothetical protein GDO86_016274 [Hymenochirus boettgeri]|uniref:Coiled-coil domain-containing protein 177 n=1 Tax=Hymenochirus boettgeri TaxID=247094 RepID=A0A8T2JYZ2_9PIPI|nr:hypothetical protein GDO86_016274 [Hymenochirus boettgeri]